MKFLNPMALWGLLAISIPIIVHLFNFRRYKRVLFSDISFLKEIKEQTQAKSKLKHYLILASRIFFILGIVLAFAQPYFPGKDSTQLKKGKLVSVFIDNSFSMQGENKNGPLLEQVKKAAVEIAMAYNETDLFQLLTNSFEGKHQRLITRDEFMQEVQEIKLHPASRTLDEIVKRQQDALLQKDPQHAMEHQLFVLSDFQKKMTGNKGKMVADSLSELTFIPFANNSVANVYIDSVWISNPFLKINESNEVVVRLVNKGKDELTDKPVTLFVNGVQTALGTIKALPGEAVEIKMPFVVKNEGLNSAYLTLDDYPITYDDKYYFSFLVKSKLNVLLISEEDATPYCELFLKNDNLFNYTLNSTTNIDYNLFGKQSTILLNGIKSISSGLHQELLKFMKDGGCVVLIPSLKADLTSINSFLGSAGAGLFTGIDTLTTSMEKPDPRNELFAEVFEKNQTGNGSKLDLPLIGDHFKCNAEGLMPLATLVNKDLFVGKRKVDKGTLFLTTTSLQNNVSNLGKHALFVPLMYKMVLNAGAFRPVAFTLGSNALVKTEQPENKEEAVIVTNADKSVSVIPSQRKEGNIQYVFVGNEIVAPGNYFLGTKERPALDGMSLNYSRNESALDFLDADMLSSWAETVQLNAKILEGDHTNFTNQLKAEFKGDKLWRVFVIMALLFLVLEILLLRFLK